jgi:Plasma-membrane choline transporter
LFYSAAENFGDSDDQTRERDALRASRRNFGAFFGLGLNEDEEGEQHDDSFISDEGYTQQDITGMAASWRPPFKPDRALRQQTIEESIEESELTESVDSDVTTRPLVKQNESEQARDYLFNPEDSQVSASEPPGDLQVEVPLDDDDETHSENSQEVQLRGLIPEPLYQDYPPEGSFRSYSPRQPMPDNALPQPVSAPPLASASHDSTWAAFYGLSMSGMFATWFLIWIGTETPESGIPMGDTIYSTLRTALPLLISDAILAVGIAVIWLILMKHALQPFVYLLCWAVPVSMFTLFLVPLIQSFGGRWDGSALQDRVMRWGSLIPAIVGAWWVYKMWVNRYDLRRSVSIIALAGKLVQENPALIPFDFSVLGAFIAFTFIWILMFCRVFLRSYKVVDGGMPCICHLC